MSEKSKTRRSEVVSMVAESCGETKILTKKIVDATFETIAKILESGGEVSIVEFGAFNLLRAKERESVNPFDITKKVMIPAKTRVRFKAFSQLMERVNAGKNPKAKPVTGAANKAPAGEGKVKGGKKRK